MSVESYRAIRYRNYAEELRVVAAEHDVDQNRFVLLKVAADYDRMAAALEVIAQSKAALEQIDPRSGSEAPG